MVVFVETCSDWTRGNDYDVIVRKNMTHNVTVWSGDKSELRRKGFVTTRPTKEAALIMLQEHLDLGTIHLADQIISQSGEHAANIRELFLQMGRFGRVVKPVKDVLHMTPRNNLTGKGPGGAQDDMIMALQQVLVGAREHMKQIARR